MLKKEEMKKDGKGLGVGKRNDCLRQERARSDLDCRGAGRRMEVEQVTEDTEIIAESLIFLKQYSDKTMERLQEKGDIGDEAQSKTCEERAVCLQRRIHSCVAAPEKRGCQEALMIRKQKGGKADAWCTEN